MNTSPAAIADRARRLTRVRVTAHVGRAFAPTFVGWADYDFKLPAAEQGLVDVPVGATATVIGVQQHGSAPFTRWVLEVDGVGVTSGVDPAAVEVL